MKVFIKYIGFSLLFIPLKGYAANSVSQPKEEPDSVRILEELVVTGVSTSDEIRTPVPVFSIDESKIRSAGITDISDAIHRLPGVTLRDYGGAGGMKTVSVRGLGASHTAVVYDGMPLTDIQSGAIDLSRYTVDNISSLELIIGDNPDIFIPVRGAASPASLAISTPDFNSNKNTTFTAQLKAGSFGYISPFFRLTQRLGHNVKGGISGEFLHTDNNYPFILHNGNLKTKEKRDHNRVNSGHAEAYITWALPGGGSLRAKAYYYDNDRQLPGPVLYYNIGNSQENLRDRNTFLQADFLQPFNEKWKLRIGGKFNWAATLYTDYSVIRDDKYKTENYFQREYYATGNLLFSPLPSLNFSYSADYSYNNLNSNLKNDARPHRNALLQALTIKYYNSRVTLLGRIIESLYFEGAKSPLVEKKTYSKLSPSLSASGKLLSTGLLYARISYKNIFRMPSFNEAYFNHYGSPDLKPESTDQIDFGLTYQLPYYTRLPLLSFTADVYRNWVHDRIVAVPYNMFMWTITNLNSVHVWGADITLNSTIDLGKRQQLLLSGTWSYQRAKINVPESDMLYGKQVAYTPHNSGSFSLSYENPWVNVVLHGQGTSAKYAQNSNIPQTRLPGYFEFGATIWREIQIKKCAFELRLDLLNMLDKQYVVIARYPMPGRSFMASLKFRI